MIVSVILCGLMSIVILFFVIANNGFSAVSIFYGLFLMFISGGMTFSENKKKGSGTIYRRIFLTTYAVFFCIGFIANLFAERGSMAITNEALATCELPFCHIVIPQGLLSYLATQTVIFPARVSGHFASIASMLGIWLVFTLVLGRGWCAWVCFYGGLIFWLITRKSESFSLDFCSFWFLPVLELCRLFIATGSARIKL